VQLQKHLAFYNWLFILFLAIPLYAGISIEEPAITHIKPHSVSIEWTTSQKTSGIIEYGTSSELGLIQKSPDFSEGHTVSLDHLKPNQKYIFKMSVQNEKGEKIETKLYSFKTEPLEDSEDATLIKITSSPQVTLLSPYNVTISWETNTPSSSIVFYGVKGKRPKTYISDLETTTHIITLENLTPDVRYFYQVKSKGPQKKITTSAYSSFVTQTKDNHKILPYLLEGPSIATRSSEEIKIEWSTDRPCKSHITWGKVPLASFQTKKAITGEPQRNHTLYLKNLSRGTRYFYTIFLDDNHGNKNHTEVYSFKTEGLD